MAIQAPDATTLVVALRHAASYFPEIAATPTAFVVPPNADASRGWQTVDGFIGSGPYVADSLDDQALVLVANPEYVAGPPPINRVQWLTQVDSDSVAAYADDQVDLAGVSAVRRQLDRVRPRLRAGPARGGPAERPVLRLRHHPSAVRRRAGAPGLRAGARPIAAGAALRGRCRRAGLERRAACALARRARRRPAARRGRGAAPARPGGLRRPPGPGRDRGGGCRAGRGAGGGGLARRAGRRRSRSRAWSSRDYLRRPGGGSAAGLHHQLDRRLPVALRALQPAAAATGRQQLRRLDRSDLRASCCRRPRPPKATRPRRPPTARWTRTSTSRRR